MDKGTINSDGSLPEASGLAYSRRTDGVIWTFNDSGGENKIYAISEQGDRRAIHLPKEASINKSLNLYQTQHVVKLVQQYN